MNYLFNSILVFSVFSFSGNAFGSTVLQNCYKNSESGQFFASKLEEISKNAGQAPVLLLNSNYQVVGVIAVTPQRAENDKVKSVSVNEVELCSSALETSSFYYVEDVSENLLKWVGAKQNEVQITQDEGLLVVNAKVEKKEAYATLIRAEFKAYDVFSEEEVNTPENRKQLDFIEDWGLPRGKGEFFFYIPAEWLKK
ncbi:MAG: hypothetical protein IPM97_03575 [Bdellovibrionaceae bacterium]|nr:hypothetical protein [Pseudobdellovibrionaceae bacterium]